MKTIIIKEPFGQDWKRELLSYPLCFKKGKCHKDSVSLSGPNGSLPCHLLELKYWSGTDYVKTAKFAFIADIPAFSVQEYHVSYTAHSVSSKVLESYLKVVTSPDEIQVSNNQIRVSFINGKSHYEQAVSSDKVPGPVNTIKIANGPVFGKSLFFGNRKIKSLQSSLIENGPLMVVVRFICTYAKCETLTLDFSIATGDSHVFVSETWSGDSLDDGWKLYLKPGFNDLVLDKIPWEFGANSWGAKMGETIDVDLTKQTPGPITNLVPWNDWWDDRTQTNWIFKTPSLGKVLSIFSTGPGEWVEPAPPGTLCPWDGWRRKMLAVCMGEEKDIFLKMNAANGKRNWAIGTASPGLGHKFQNIKEMVLDWPESQKHPYLFLNSRELSKIQKNYTADHGRIRKLIDLGMEESHGKPHIADSKALAAYLLTGSPKIAKKLRLVERLRMYMDCSGNFDKMRFLSQAVFLFDALIDSDLISARERETFQAQMAFLGYHLADPFNWSIERGYRSYNLNMSVSHLLNLGRIACVLKDHPMSKTWLQTAILMMEDMLNQVGPEGEWPESVSNYVYVSASGLLSFAIMAKNVGFADYINDPRMKKLCSFMVKQYCPCDIRTPEESLRALPPHGRSNAGHRWALAGLMARAILESDPEFSEEQQWCWLQTGPTYDVEQFGGWEEVYTDTDLPAKRPRWESESFPQSGVIFRNGFGTENETCVNLISADFNHQVFPSETGAFSMIHAKGAPLAGSFFGGYAEREELLTSRVSLARTWNQPEKRKQSFGYSGTTITPEEEMSGKRKIKKAAQFGVCPGISNIREFTHLPRLDYTMIDIAMIHPQPFLIKLADNLPEWPNVSGDGHPPLDWRRQAIMMKGETSEQASYLVIRDTVQGKQPTIWSMWTLSNNLDTPENISKLKNSFEKCNHSIQAAREISGDRFTAIGQHGVDVEYFIAAPTDTPRHTLRWGLTYKPERCVWHHVSKLLDDYPEYRDLLHLQLPGDGSYFVAFFPRKRNEKAPVFKSLGNGNVIKVSGEFGTDYSFLNHEKIKISESDFSFEGIAGGIQDRKEGLALSLASAGSIRFRDITISSVFPVEVHLSVNHNELTFHASENLRQVKVKIPGKWNLMPKGDNGSVSLESKADYFIINIKKNVKIIRLTRRSS